MANSLLPFLIILFYASFIFAHQIASTTAEEDKDDLDQKYSNAKRKLKILVYASPLSYSHYQFMGAIADTLQEAGHEVHYFKFIGDPFMRNKNETSLVHRVHLLELNGINADNFAVDQKGFTGDWFAGNYPAVKFWQGDPMRQVFVPMSADTCREVIGKTELLDGLAKEDFDVAITEAYDLCPLAVIQRIGARTKLVAYATSLNQILARRFSLPGFASFMPNMQVPHSSPLETSFISRWLNFLNEFYDWLYWESSFVKAQVPMIRRAFGADFPPLTEIARNISLVFINSSPFLEMPRPYSSKFVHIGGLVDARNRDKKDTEKKPELGDERIRHILESAVDGVVLLSFGSAAETRLMPVQMRRAILRAFARFPTVQFIWKLDTESRQNDSDLFDSAPNVHTFKWIPQYAMLAHPNLRAFITHCGHNSLTEAANAGIPIVAVALFADQIYNSILARKMGIGTLLDVGQLNGPNGEISLVEALEELSEKAQSIKHKLALTPFSPVEKLVRWVEFAAEFTELNELNLPSEEEMSLFVYYSLDAISFTIGILLGLVWLTWKFAQFIYRKCQKKGERKMKKQ